MKQPKFINHRQFVLGFTLLALTFFLSIFFSERSFAEVTEVNAGAPYDIPVQYQRGYNPDAYGTLRQTPRTGSSNIPSEIRSAYNKLTSFHAKKGRKERYAFINKYKNTKSQGKHYKTYVVDLQSGKVVDKFVSLVGYNGIGCRKGQTRPGIFRLNTIRGRGASRKPWWGNNYKYIGMSNIGGHSKQWGGYNCGLNYQHVAHSNRNMLKNSKRKHRRYSAGCFVTSPDMFTKWTEKMRGNALIYNLKPGQ